MLALIAIALVKLPSRIGYLALAGLVAGESTGLPLPGETALIAAGVLSHNGHFKLGPVIAVAAVAAIVGDNIGYLIGRTGGRTLLERPGFLLHYRHRILERGEPFFERHGPKAVFLGRWAPGLRVAAAWLAGINRMHWPVFLFWNGVGGIAWATSVALLAYAVGPTAVNAFKVVGIVWIGLIVALVVGYLLWRHLLSRTNSNPRPPE